MPMKVYTADEFMRQLLTAEMQTTESKLRTEEDMKFYKHPYPLR